MKSYPPLEEEQITASSSSFSVDVVVQHHLENNSAASPSLPLTSEGNDDFKLFPAVLHSASFSVPSSENAINKAAQLTFLQVPLFDGKEDADLIDTDYTGDNIVGYFKGHTQHHAIGDKNKLTEMYGKVFFVRELSLSDALNAGESCVCIIWRCDEYDAACFVERLTLQQYEGFFSER